MGAGWKFEVIWRTMQEGDNQLSVSMLCEIAGVSRSGYYRWVNSADIRDEREKKDRENFELILKAYSQHGYSKGARGIYMCMIHWKPPVVMNLKKIRRLMDKYGLMCPVRKANPYRRMAKALKTNHVADNLLNRKFTEYGPRKVLLTDITYLPYNDKELRQSMSRKGNCWDNAPQESFFGHMKDEIDISECIKYREVKAIIDDWMEYYNSERYQWQLGKLSPDEYYGYITTGIYPLKGIIGESQEKPMFPKTN